MSWAQVEFHDLALGDARRTQRLIRLVDDWSAQPTGSIPLTCDVVFDPEEWQAAWIVAHRTKPPETLPPLGQKVRLIVGFGGFLGCKHDARPQSDLGRPAKSESVCYCF